MVDLTESWYLVYASGPMCKWRWFLWIATIRYLTLFLLKINRWRRHRQTPHCSKNEPWESQGGWHRNAWCRKGGPRNHTNSRWDNRSQAWNIISPYWSLYNPCNAVYESLMADQDNIFLFMVFFILVSYLLKNRIAQRILAPWLVT